MTMTAEQLARLREVAERAAWGNWQAYKPHKGARGYEVKNGVEAVAQHCIKHDAGFIASANPKTVLALLDELERKEKEKSELKSYYEGVIADGSKRIAELEARTVTVKLPESVIDAICLTAAEIHNLGRGVSDERAQEIINSIRCAAGINLTVEG
ncbi:ead/Ea22-like family protein [Atlantibacter hermannii]|uniref:ead/Ea22-like family protein n=1 Tax=Atlantibacter hermannii TaxID=565 RepID=UPI0028AC29E4|nr:ead/Ea22-like family protein [Atlantibacter hermannii]